MGSMGMGAGMRATGATNDILLPWQHRKRDVTSAHGPKSQTRMRLWTGKRDKDRDRDRDRNRDRERGA